MSESVATALAECSQVGLAGFTNSEQMEKLLHHINDIFDVLNSRSMHQRGWKKLLNEAKFKDAEELSFHDSVPVITEGISKVVRNGVPRNKDPGTSSFWGNRGTPPFH